MIKPTRVTVESILAFNAKYDVEGYKRKLNRLKQAFARHGDYSRYRKRVVRLQAQFFGRSYLRPR